jgi:hypothetical protein
LLAIETIELLLEHNNGVSKGLAFSDMAISTSFLSYMVNTAGGFVAKYLIDELFCFKISTSSKCSAIPIFGFSVSIRYFIPPSTAFLVIALKS